MFDIADVASLVIAAVVFCWLGTRANRIRNQFLRWLALVPRAIGLFLGLGLAPSSAQPPIKAPVQSPPPGETGGKKLKGMPWNSVGGFASDDDLRAMYAYLRGLQLVAN